MFRLNTTTLCLLGAIVILVGIVLYLYSTKKENLTPPEEKAPPLPEPRQQSPAAAPQGSPGPPILVLFKADWCGHCKALAPAWAEVEKALSGKHLVKAVDSNDPEMAKHKVRGFPCIRYFPQGLNITENFVEYPGERTAQGILHFLQNPSGQAPRPQA